MLLVIDIALTIQLVKVGDEEYKGIDVVRYVLDPSVGTTWCLHKRIKLFGFLPIV